MKSSVRPLCRSITSCLAGLATALVLPTLSWAEGLTILHVGDQESWLLSAQGNLRDDNSQPISCYGGVDRLATVIANASSAATTAGRFVLKLNAGDSPPALPISPPPTRTAVRISTTPSPCAASASMPLSLVTTSSISARPWPPALRKSPAPPTSR